MSLTGKIEDDNIPLADDDPQGKFSGNEKPKSLKRLIEFNHLSNCVFNFFYETWNPNVLTDHWVMLFVNCRFKLTGVRVCHNLWKSFVTQHSTVPIKPTTLLNFISYHERTLSRTLINIFFSAKVVKTWFDLILPLLVIYSLQSVYLLDFFILTQSPSLTSFWTKNFVRIVKSSPDADGIFKVCRVIWYCIGSK